MELNQVYIILGLLAAVFYYVYLIHRWRPKNSSSKQLPLPPGPAGIPVLGSLPFLDPELHTYFAGLAKAHGPIYTIKLGSKLGIVISSPDLAREALRDNDAVLANRDVPAVAHVIAYGASDIVWTPNGPTWRMLRRVCVQKMLSSSSLDSVYHLRRREMMSTIHHLHESSGKPVDVGAQVFLSVLNVITSVLWGGTMDNDKKKEVGFEFRELVGDITELLGKPNVSDFFPALANFDIQGISKKMKVYLGKFDKIFERIIEQRTSNKERSGGGAKDLLDFMLGLEAEGGDSNLPFTMTHVKALLMDMVVGGTDTTSNTVEWTIAEMMNRPDTMNKAQEELEQVVGKNNIVEESHIPKLHYLSSIMKEVLRLHPALPLLVPHCPSESCTIGGYNVPQGSRVFINVWAIHRDSSVWENPNEFLPERFFEAGSKYEYNGSDFKYFPFGSGRRICAGISMAERMSMYTVASLLHNFEWKLEVGENIDLAEKFGIVLKKAKPLIAIPTPRFDNFELYS